MRCVLCQQQLQFTAVNCKLYTYCVHVLTWWCQAPAYFSPISFAPPPAGKVLSHDVKVARPACAHGGGARGGWPVAWLALALALAPVAVAPVAVAPVAVVTSHLSADSAPDSSARQAAVEHAAAAAAAASWVWKATSRPRRNRNRRRAKLATPRSLLAKASRNKLYATWLLLALAPAPPLLLGPLELAALLPRRRHSCSFESNQSVHIPSWPSMSGGSLDKKIGMSCTSSREECASRHTTAVAAAAVSSGHSTS